MRVEKQTEEKKQAGQTREIKVGTIWKDEKQGMKEMQFFHVINLKTMYFFFMIWESNEILAKFLVY